MEARLLDFFLRTLELGSINRAAAELSLSQPALSRWLSILERQIGQPLLIRTRQGIRPTDAGELLADRARPILRQLNALRDEIGEKTSAQVALGMPSSMQQLITAPFAYRMARENPHISVRVYEGLNNDLRRWMEQGVVDAAVMLSTEHAPDAFNMMPLICEQLVLIGDKSAGLQLDTPVPISRVGAVEIILPGRPKSVRAHVENALHRVGLRYRSRFEAETPSLCLELTKRGLGFTVMPYCALHGRPDVGEFSAAPIRNLKVIWALYVNHSREYSVAVRALNTKLAAFINSQIASGLWPFAQAMHARTHPSSMPGTRRRARSI